ncbi:MAG: ABC transporter ATP-binding protein [Alphaproteobacteria bacterium]|nr:ABC transporter ATP-binding protein [Alphaproteobacteria bacterium]
MSFIEVSNVDLVYRGNSADRRDEGTPALAGIELAIEEGSFVSVVGPSGCGKSTLLRLLSGLMLPSRGTVRVDGRRVDAPLKTVGIAFQNSTLLPWRNVRDNVLLPLEIVAPHRARFRKNKSVYVARTEKLLDAVGLDGFGDRMPWQLSGGMQQRAELCRALIHEPAILLLDEPFAALDPFTREELWRILQALFTDRRCTVILVTHELREAVFLSDTVHIMSARPGRVIASRSIALTRPRLLEMTYRRDFVDLVQELRRHIGNARAA